jgi:hypothetical protein
MKSIIVAVLALTLGLAAPYAFADHRSSGRGHDNDNGDNGNNNSNTNRNTNRNTNLNAQGQHQSQGQSMSQGQLQGQSTSNANNAKQVVTITNEQLRQAVAASAPSMPATASCVIGLSGGVGTPIGGLSLGGYYRDDECRKMELGRSYVELGIKLQSMELVMKGLSMYAEVEKSVRVREAPLAGETAAPESYVQ